MFASRFKMVALALVMVPTISLAEANDDVESRVRAYFADAPIMISIAKCESEFRQFGASGALHGGAGRAMVGVFQVHSDVHADFALSKGMDIYTLEGNLAYARYLYEREGTRPWLSSFPCWNKESVNPELASTTVPRTDLGNTKSGSESALLSINLSMGMEHESVRALQKMLNNAGYTIADSARSRAPRSGNSSAKRSQSVTAMSTRADTDSSAAVRAPHLPRSVLGMQCQPCARVRMRIMQRLQRCRRRLQS